MPNALHCLECTVSSVYFLRKSHPSTIRSQHETCAGCHPVPPNAPTESEIRLPYERRTAPCIAHGPNRSKEQRAATPTPLVDLLHLGALVAVLLEGGQLLDIVGLIIILDGQTELDHAVDAASKGG